jgi:hypothetical protein
MQGDLLHSRSPQLFISDMFGGRKTVGVRGVGDFSKRIQNVFVNLTYADSRNKYVQTKSQALSAGTPFFDWTFPVISQTGGVVTYTATTTFQDFTSEDVSGTASSDTILLPAPAQAFLEVMVVTDLIPWDQVRLVRLSLSYSDPPHQISVAKDYVFGPPPKNAGVTWHVDLKDRNADKYTYAITYFLTTGQRTVDGTSNDRTLILEPPL